MGLAPFHVMQLWSRGAAELRAQEPWSQPRSCEESCGQSFVARTAGGVEFWVRRRALSGSGWHSVASGGLRWPLVAWPHS
jgi:hypothetical protein